MNWISDMLSVVVDYAWGMPLVVLLMGGGLYLAIVSRFVPLLGFKHAVLLIAGKIHTDGEEESKGQLTHFRALTNALASTVGMGNIAGVAVAITQGGPGAIFWMWLAALFGMNTKFFECALSVKYRGADHEGEVQGGPMYVIQSALGKKWIPMAYLFAFFGMMGTLPLFNINQLSSYVSVQYGVDPLAIGILCAIVVGYILIGGVRSIGAWTSKLVPIMCLFYVIVALVIVVMNIEKVPSVFDQIFTYAFTGMAAWGGATGLAVRQIFIIGVKRAAFSNEAGVGTAPMAHSNAKTEEPVAEGLVAMVGPFVDTIVVCTLTALVILTTLPYESIPADAEGVLITRLAFERNFGSFGIHFLSVAVILFAFSTVLGTANYCQKCWNFLFKGKKGFGTRSFIAAYALLLIIGSVTEAGDVVNFLDICFAFMAFPNMLVTIRLAHRVRESLKDYWAKYKVA